MRKTENPQEVSVYQNDIFEFLISQNRVSKALVQEDLNEKMRSILIDWVVEVHLKFHL